MPARSTSVTVRAPADTLSRADAIARAAIARGGPILTSSYVLASAALIGLDALERDPSLLPTPERAQRAPAAPGDLSRPIVADTNPSRARRAEEAARARRAAGCTCPTSRHRRGCALASPALPLPPPAPEGAPAEEVTP